MMTIKNKYIRYETETMRDRDLDLKWSAGGNLSIT